MAIALVDYDSGNLHSAHKAFEYMSQEVGAGDVVITSDPDLVAKADAVILPGDGAFPACKQHLFDHTGMFEAIKESAITRARPFMGICIGMQMMASAGFEYNETAGFDWIEGKVVAIAPNDQTLKIPHMGWNELILSKEPHPVLDGIQSGEHAYFVHSYHFEVSDPAHRLAHVEYGGDITAMVGRDTMIGCQFHPEKSQDVGLQLIKNFLQWRP